MTKVVVASDHAGFRLKEQVKAWLSEAGCHVEDLGPASDDRVDYPDFAHQVASRVAGGHALGVLVCGSGIGMAIAANRTPGARAVNASGVFQAEMARRHNNANILCLGERFVGPDLARAVVEKFLSTDFEGGRHAARVEKIEDTQTGVLKQQ